MVDNMVVCMKLVITTLFILNSIGKVSPQGPQDQLEHGLATDCLFMSNYLHICISEVSKAKYVAF